MVTSEKKIILSFVHSIGNIPINNKIYSQAGVIYDTNGVSPTITTASAHGNGMPFVISKRGKKNETS